LVLPLLSWSHHWFMSQKEDGHIKERAGVVGLIPEGIAALVAWCGGTWSAPSW